MNSCIHCGHEFETHAQSPSRGVATTVCPSCGRDTPVGEANWSPDVALAGAPAAESRVYCFNCGKAMTPREGELIPVCDECRQDRSQATTEATSSAPTGDEPVADWMIRKANGNVYGPFPRETIVEWIRARKINPDEEVAHIGGAWRLFGQHEDFGKYFDKPADPTAAHGTQEFDFRRRSPVRDAMRSTVRAAVAVVGLGGLGYGIWYAIDKQVLVLSEGTINKVADTVSAAAPVAGGPDAPRLAEDATKLLAELDAAYPELKDRKATPGTSAEFFLRGRMLMLKDNAPNLRAARKALESSVVLDPGNVLALGALAELYNLLAYRGEGSLDLQRKSIYLIEIAEAQANFPAETLRARATFLIRSGNLEEGRGVAEQALQKNPEDPSLHFLLGLAAEGKDGSVSETARGHFDKALELESGYHQVWYELGRGEERAGRLREAISYYEKKTAADAESAASHTRLGNIYERVGDVQRASAHYDQAVALDGEYRDAVVRRAVLAYQVDGQAARAAQMLAALLEKGGSDENELRIKERKEIGIHLSAARRLMDDAPGALEAAEAVLKEDKNNSAALFHKGLALLAQGKSAEAVPVLSQAEQPDVPARERALVHFFQGRAAQLAKQTQDSLDEYTRATEVDPSLIPAWLWAADVSLSLGDATRAAAAALEHIGHDPLEYGRIREPGLYYEPLPSLAPVAADFKKAASAVAFGPDLYAATGVVLFHMGDFDGARGFLKDALKQQERHEGARFYSALVELKKGAHAAAGAHLQALVDVVHNKGVYHLYFGDTLLEQGRLDEAIASYEKAIGYGTKSAWIYTRLAEALARKGESDRAKKELELAVAADSGAVAPRKQRFQLEL